MNKPLFRLTNLFRLLGALLVIVSGFVATPQLTIIGIFGQAMPVAGILLFAGPLLVEMLRGNGTDRSSEDYVSFWRFSNLLRVLGLALLILSIFFSTPVVDIKGVGGEVLPLAGVLILCGPTFGELYRAVKDRITPKPKAPIDGEGGVP